MLKFELTYRLFSLRIQFYDFPIVSVKDDYDMRKIGDGLPRDTACGAVIGGTLALCTQGFLTWTLCTSG